MHSQERVMNRGNAKATYTSCSPQGLLSWGKIVCLCWRAMRGASSGKASQAVGLVRAACPKGMWGGGGDGCGHCTHHYLFFPLQRRSTTGVTLSTAAVGVAAASRPGQRTRLLTLDSTSDVSQWSLIVGVLTGGRILWWTEGDTLQPSLAVM